MSGNLSENAAPRVSVRDVLNKWFWLNYVITLVATCWIPLLTVTPIFTVGGPSAMSGINSGELAASPVAVSNSPEIVSFDGPGGQAVMRGEPQKVRLYTCYYKLLQGRFKHYALPVALHLSLCFVVSFWTWRIVLKAGRRSSS